MDESQFNALIHNFSGVFWDDRLDLTQAGMIIVEIRACCDTYGGSFSGSVYRLSTMFDSAARSGCHQKSAALLMRA